MVGTSRSGKRAQPRKPHNKTRTGCGHCRQRRVKCTEERPACRSCARREVECRYPSLDQRPPSSPSAPSRRQKSLDTQVKSPVIRTPVSDAAFGTPHALLPPTPGAGSPATTGTNSFTLQDVALFHHWMTSICLDFSNSPLADRLWKVEVPKMAFEHPFLFYAILSIAVLHRAHIEGSHDQGHGIAATHYHNEGLRLFRSELQNISPNNCEALFVWSALNAMYILARPRASYEEAVRTRDRAIYDAWRDDILGTEWIPLHRGIRSLLHPEGVDLKKTRLAAIFILGNYFELDPHDIDTGLAGQELMRAPETWANDTQADVYSKTLEVLHRCLAFISQEESSGEEQMKPGSRGFVKGLLFPIHCFTEDFLKLLRQRQPPALVLFSFYGAFLHRGRRYWALKSWGEDIVRVTSELLGAYWRPWIQWPLHAIEEKDD